MSQSQTRAEAVAMVKSVIENGQRIDRYLRVADGEYYTSPDKTLLGHDGPWTPPYVVIPCGYDIDEDEAEECAEALLRELDD